MSEVNDFIYQLFSEDIERELLEIILSDKDDNDKIMDAIRLMESCKDD